MDNKNYNQSGMSYFETATRPNNSSVNNDNNNSISNNQNNNINSNTQNNSENISNNEYNPQPEIVGQNMNNNDNSNNNNSSSNNDFTEDFLLQAYIGDKYYKIIKSKFNIGGFLLSSLYFFYRKMFLYGFISIILSLVLLNCFGTISGGLYFVYALVVGLFVDKIYISFAKRKVYKISQSNPDNAREICAKKGGTSIGGVVLGCLFYVIVIAIALIFSVVFNLSSFIGSSLQSSSNGVFDGSFDYMTSSEISEIFNIDIPSIFTEDGFFNSEYIYDYENDISSCNFIFAGLKGFSDAEDLIKQMIEYYASSSNISHTEINGLTWYYFEYKSYTTTTYYFATTYKTNVYLVEYNMDASDDGTCYNNLNPLLYSISEK